MKNATYNLYHDTRRPLKDGTFPIKLMVTFRPKAGRVIKYYPTDQSCTVKDFQKVIDGSNREDLVPIRKIVRKLEARAGEIFALAPFLTDPAHFEAELYKKASVSTTMIVPLFQQEEERLYKLGKIGSRNMYKDARNSLTRYAGEGLLLENIDRDFLEAYEKDMIAPADPKAKEKTLTTVGMYLRCLRAVFNSAMDQKPSLISREYYPFGRKGYVIPVGANTKKALTDTLRDKLLKSKTRNEAEARALAAWTFSYYCNGMNFMDIAYLTPKDIDDDVLTFVRRKTVTTKKVVAPIQVIIRPEVKRILKGLLKGCGRNEFIFKVFTKEDSIEMRIKKEKQWIKETNKLVKAIAKRNGITQKVTTYVARHTFTTTAIRGEGVTGFDVRDALGHSSITTTERYIAGMNIEQKRKIASLL